MDKYRNDKAEWRMIESKIGDTELGNEGLLNKLELDEARGMMVGTAIGDAMGAPLEFEPKCRPEDNLVTDMIGGGQETSVTFDMSSLDPSGDYSYFCTFPGHYAIMKGKFIIE